MTTFKTLTDEISDQFLACKLCLETYKKPKTLSCLHTFCTSCLEAHLESEQEKTNYRFVIYSRGITCPVCKKRTEVPSGGVRNLPDNFLVSNLTEVVNRSKPTSTTPVCDICTNYKKRSRDAVSKCLECSKFLCRNCVDLHKKTKVTKGHNIFDVEVEKNIMCKCHEDEPVRFFCQPCETCICIVCTFQEHIGHEVSSFGEGILKYVGNIQNMLRSSKRKMSSVQRHLDIMTKCEETIANVEERVNKLSATFLAMIRTQQKQIIDEIREFYGSEALEILDNKDELEQIMSNLKSTCGLTELILENRNVELLLLQKEVKEKMKSFINVDLPDLPDSMKKEIDFVEGSMNLGYLDTGNKSSISGRWISRSSDEEGEAYSRGGSKDACTMTVISTKDRGMCTDPYVTRSSTGHFEDDSPDSVRQDADSSGHEEDQCQEEKYPADDPETTFRRILERRESLYDSFRDDEKFFDRLEEEEEQEVKPDVEEISTSTVVDIESVEASGRADDTGDETYDVSNGSDEVSDVDTAPSAALDGDGFVENEESGTAAEIQEEGDLDPKNGEEEFGKDKKARFDVHEYIKCERVEVEETCPDVVATHRDAATVTEDTELLEHYTELCLETDSGQILTTLDPGLSVNRETMAEFNVQRLSSGNFTSDIFSRNDGREAPWQVIHDMNELPLQTEDKGINVPDVVECDSSLEIEFIDVMLRDHATSTEIVDKTDQETMTECVGNLHQVNTTGNKDQANETVTQETCSLIKSDSQTLLTQAISDTLALTADTKKGLLELADGFYHGGDMVEFASTEPDKAVTPDDTELFSKSIQLSDSPTDADVSKVDSTGLSCGVVQTQDEAIEAIAEMVETSTSPETVSVHDFGVQTTRTEVDEFGTMTETTEVTDTAMSTEMPIVSDRSCGTDQQRFSTIGTGTISPGLVDQAVGNSIKMKDTGCGDSVATVRNVDVTAMPEMVDSSCSPDIIICLDTSLQTEGWDFKDAYVDTDAIDMRDIFTEMPQLSFMDVFTNTHVPESVDEATVTDITQFEDQGSGTEPVLSSMVGTLTDLLRMCDAAVETTSVMTSDAASAVSPENETKETMTPVIITRDAASNARFRRKKPARESAGTSTDSVELVDSSTSTFMETSSVGLSVVPETREDSTETVQPKFVDSGVEAAPAVMDASTHAPTFNTRDSSTDPIKPQQVNVGINTYIVSLAPRKRDASTTTARTIEEISQELESVVMKGAIGGATQEERREPEVDSDLLGQKIGELFSLAKLQSLTEKLAHDRRKMEEQRSRKHVLPTARMLEKRLSVDETPPIVVRRRLSSHKSVDMPEVDCRTEAVLQDPDQSMVARTEKTEILQKRRPNISALLNLPKVSDVDIPAAGAYLDTAPAEESSLDVTPGVSPCVTPSGDNLSSFSDAVEPIKEKKRKHKKEKKKSREKEEERIRKSSSLTFGSKHGASAMATPSATTPEDGNPKKHKAVKKPLFSLGRFSKSLPTLARLDEKIDRFFRKSTSRETTPCTSVATTPQTSRSGSPDRHALYRKAKVVTPEGHPPHRKARPPKVSAFLEQTILEKVKVSTSDSGQTEEEVDLDDIARESNV